jgi:proteasome activator subunit 4
MMIFRFFKSDATREILSAILPLINLHDSTNFCTYIGLLTILLPVDRLPLQSNSQEEASNFYWVPILIYFWSCCGNSSTLDMLFLDIFGRLAKYHGSYPEKIGWSSLDMAFIFSRGTRLLGLSVGSGTSGIDAKHLAKKGLSDSGIMDLGMPLGSYFYTVIHLFFLTRI